MDIKSKKYQKLRGGYYTPKLIVDFLANWAIDSCFAEILEPSFGDGLFLQASAEIMIKKGGNPKEIDDKLYGVELDAEEVDKARKKLNALGVKGSNIVCGDFFSHCADKYYGGLLFGESKRFDVVIGNPPFIRYQDFPDAHRDLAFQLMRSAGLNPNKLTNIWIPFLVISSLLLKDTGRLAMVIPAELFQVNYSAETRKFLSDFFSRLTIVTFSKLVFDDIQQEVVLLLGERDTSAGIGIKTIEFHDENDLKMFSQEKIDAAEIKSLDHTKEKWVKYFLTNKEIGLLREYSKHTSVVSSRNVLDVDVGVVTGDNNYFLLKKSDLVKFGLANNVTEIVSRSTYLSGIFFSLDDQKEKINEDFRMFLFSPRDAEKNKLSQKVREYIDLGENNEVNKGYKCRIRNKWYVVPSLWIPDAFMLRQVHKYPKLIMNCTQATCTDTIHRVKFKGEWKKDFVTAAFINSLTFASSEVKGRSYGGGVLTFEPSEMEDLPLPLVGYEKVDPKEIDKAIRADNVKLALETNDKILLADGLGMSNKDIIDIRAIWEKLRDRRVNRK